jgi:UDP-N-acetylglucosamine 2-epimerase (non-hydrolysing)
MKILNIVGARPNFMKVAPLHRAFSKNKNIVSKIVHTGQHFDASMSDVFFNQLELPKPDYFLGVGSGTHTELTAKIMSAFEPILLSENPDLVLVVGDVTSTLACALVAVRNNIKVAHVESGLRSGDRSMPEEINRLLTDQISDFLFITESGAEHNLLKENIAREKIFFVGNCMIDSLKHYLPKANLSPVLQQLNLSPREYLVMTMHRPSNVDSFQGLSQIIEILNAVTQKIKVVFPIHPRTRNKLKEFGMLDQLISNENIVITEALGYIEFIAIMNQSKLILTDSGGIQEETTFLQIPCLTFRSSTERPVTVEVGTNILMSDLNVNKTIQAVNEILLGNIKAGKIPTLWDGFAAERIMEILEKNLI